MQAYLYIFQNNPFAPNIVFFGRYIDDIIIIWDGSVDAIDLFVEYCNKNQYGLSFTFVANPNTLMFLDLELGHNEVTSTIVSKNYIKPTAGNSYLHYNSCNFPKWINNIPKGQFCRLQQNCTRESDYVDQSLLLKKKFKDKGYP